MPNKTISHFDQFFISFGIDIIMAKARGKDTSGQNLAEIGLCSPRFHCAMPLSTLVTGSAMQLLPFLPFVPGLEIFSPHHFLKKPI